MGDQTGGLWAAKIFERFCSFQSHVGKEAETRCCEKGTGKIKSMRQSSWKFKSWVIQTFRQRACHHSLMHMTIIHAYFYALHCSTPFPPSFVGIPCFHLFNIISADWSFLDKRQISWKPILVTNCHSAMLYCSVWFNSDYLPKKWVSCPDSSYLQFYTPSIAFLSLRCSHLHPCLKHLSKCYIKF